MIVPAILVAQALAPVFSIPELGKAEGRCRSPERGSAFIVQVEGLKDRKGRLELELYPANDAHFLADDDVLVNAGKPFRRVEMALPANGSVELCIRASGPGAYALSLLHDRDGDRKLGLPSDGIGFSISPKFGWSKPKATMVASRIGAEPTRLRIMMNYRRGLMSFGPLDQ